LVSSERETLVGSAPLSPQAGSYRRASKLDRLFHKVQEVVLKENILQAR